MPADRPLRADQIRLPLVEAESTWDSESLGQATGTIAISLSRQYDTNLSLALRGHFGIENPDLLQSLAKNRRRPLARAG
jgi:hypothetical protein